MTDPHGLAAGTRVQILRPPLGLRLTSRVGSIVRPDEFEGYYIVRLDAPASYRSGDGTMYTLEEIRVAAQNLTVLTRNS